MDINEELQRIKEIMQKDNSRMEFLAWKRKNVTLRGIKEAGSDNGVYGSYGRGLYTAFLSNRAMARGYGEVKFVVNAIPKKPKIVDSLNNAEMWRQQVVMNYCKKHGKSYNWAFFDDNTTLEDEIQALGYDGLIIKGREMVNYTPSDVKYFTTERQLENYYYNIVK